VALFIYLLLGAIIVIYELTRKKYFKIDLITFFNLFFFLSYSFAPAALIIGGTHLILNDMPYGSEYFGHYYFTPYIVFLSYFFFLAGFHTLSLGTNDYKWEFKFWWDEDTIMILLPFAYLLLFFFIFIYVNEFGGLFRTIELAQAYRGGAIQYNTFAFVLKFFPLNAILLYYTYYKYFLQKRKNKLLLLYFLLSLSFVLLFTVIQNSRGYLIFQLLGIYVITVNYHKNLFLKYLVPTLFVTIIIIKYASAFFNAVQFLFMDGFDAFIAAYMAAVEIKAQEDASIVSYFTHPIVSLEASLVHSGYDVGLRYFRDIKDAFLMIIPNELLGIKEPEMVLMKQNSIVLQGRAIEIVLPGILGYFSYAAQVVGVFVGSYLYGLIGVLLMRLFINLYKISKASIVYIYIFSLAYGYFVFRGVPGHVIDDAFMYLVVIGFLLIFSKLRISSVSKD